MTYTTDWETPLLDTELRVRNGRIFIIAGPSGVGKDTVVDALKKLDDYDKLHIMEPISYTTRAPRRDDAERSGAYIFVDDKRFAELIESDMIEHVESHGHFYGLSRNSFESILESGSNIIKIMNRDGALDFHRMYPADTILIYMKPPSLKVLEDRLRGRGTESWSEYNRRMLDNIRELKDISGFDYVVTANETFITARILYTIIAANIGAI